MGACLSIYISEHGEERLSQYHYTGTDKSILNKYLFAPVADFLLDHITPSWLTTDLLYIIAVIFVLWPHIVITAVLAGDLNGHVSRWLSFLTAFSLFVYIIAKNMGKRKAERTGFITPLNAFFDHQSDAVNIFLTGLSFFTIIQLGDSDFSVIAFIVAMVPFYTATWERYYTGVYDRPIINGQNEGLAIIILIEVITGIGGYRIWPQPSESGIRSNEILVLIAAAWAVISVLLNMRNVWIKRREKFWKAMFDLLMIAYTVAVLFVFCYMSVTNTVTRKARDLITYIGLWFGKYAGLFFVAHMSGDSFHFHSIWYGKWIALTFLLADVVQGYHTATSILNEGFLVQALMIYQFFRYFAFLIGIVLQIVEIEKTYPFHLPIQVKAKIDLQSLVKYDLHERPDAQTHGNTPPSRTSSGSTPIKLDMISLKNKIISLPLTLPERAPLNVECHTP